MNQRHEDMKMVNGVMKDVKDLAEGIKMEVDNPGCCDVEGLCCFMHASKK